MPVPNDWRSFTAAMPTFTTLFHKAFQMIPKLVLDTTPPEGDTAGLVIIQLMMASMPDLDDILTLSSHDGHWGALKLLRSLFERTVTLKYIAQNPAEGEAFRDFDALDWQQILTGIEAKYALRPSEEARRRIVEAAKAARKTYRQEPCSVCGLRKQTSWAPKSSKELADLTGLAYMHFEAFVMPSKYIHPTYFGSRGTSSDITPMNNTLKHTHALALETIITHQRYFHPREPISEVVLELVRDFFSVWKYSETNFDLVTRFLIALPDDFTTEMPELRECIARSPPHPNRRRYVGSMDRQPAAFAAIDLEPVFFVYELYVFREHRRSGIGTWVLTEVEKLAATEGRSKLFVRPRPLDSDIDEAQLTDWYRKRGFNESDEISDAFEKVVASIPCN
jgi:GNAT superfamily N-acetyltransferase